MLIGLIYIKKLRSIPSTSKIGKIMDFLKLGDKIKKNKNLLKVKDKMSWFKNKRNKIIKE